MTPADVELVYEVIGERVAEIEQRLAAIEKKRTGIATFADVRDLIEEAQREYTRGLCNSITRAFDKVYGRDRKP